jgi:hypothetical protein
MEKLPEWVKTSEDCDRWKRGEGPATGGKQGLGLNVAGAMLKEIR